MFKQLKHKVSASIANLSEARRFRKRGFFSAYEKVVKVINSSFSEDHFLICERLVENFSNMFPSQRSRRISLNTLLHHRKIACNKVFNHFFETRDN